MSSPLKHKVTSDPRLKQMYSVAICDSRFFDRPCDPALSRGGSQGYCPTAPDVHSAAMPPFSQDRTTHVHDNGRDPRKRAGAPAGSNRSNELTTRAAGPGSPTLAQDSDRPICRARKQNREPVGSNNLGPGSLSTGHAEGCRRRHLQPKRWHRGRKLYLDFFT